MSTARQRRGENARDSLKRLFDRPVTVAQSFSQQQAQGEFCLLALRVTNIDDAEQTFFSGDQKLLDAAGTQFSADELATSVANQDRDQTLIFEQINPGNAIEGTLVFDVPAGTQITAAELHDSAFSRGVRISLGT